MGGRGAYSGKKGGFSRGETSYKGPIPKKLESLSSIKDQKVYKSVKQAISRYESVMGVRQKDVKIGELPVGIGGVHVTIGGKSSQIILNKKLYNSKDTSYSKLKSYAEKGYKSGHLTRTNKPVNHIVTHELAHATWNSHLSGRKQRAAGKEINKLYKEWLQKKRKGYGQYAKTNVNEFYSEASVKAIHGKPDSFTKRLKSINKKYKL